MRLAKRIMLVAEVEVIIGTGRIQFDGALVGHDRLLRLAKPGEVQRQFVMILRVSRLKFECELQFFLGSFRSAKAAHRVTEQAQDERVLRIGFVCQLSLIHI